MPNSRAALLLSAEHHSLLCAHVAIGGDNDQVLGDIALGDTAVLQLHSLCNLGIELSGVGTTRLSNWLGGTQPAMPRPHKGNQDKQWCLQICWERTGAMPETVGDNRAKTSL